MYYYSQNKRAEFHTDEIAKFISKNSLWKWVGSKKDHWDHVQWSFNQSYIVYCEDNSDSESDDFLLRLAVNGFRYVRKLVLKQQKKMSNVSFSLLFF